MLQVMIRVSRTYFLLFDLPRTRSYRPTLTRNTLASPEFLPLPSLLHNLPTGKIRLPSRMIVSSLLSRSRVPVHCELVLHSSRVFIPMPRRSISRHLAGPTIRRFSKTQDSKWKRTVTTTRTRLDLISMD